VHAGAFVWADSSGAAFGSTGDNQFLIRAAGGVGIGLDHPETALDVAGTVRADALQLPANAAAGRVLTADAAGVGSWQPVAVRLQPSTGTPNMVGGANNVISNNAVGATISGGFSNRTGHEYATVGGGRDNRAYGFSGTVGGGRNNRVEAQYGTIGGGQFNRTADFGATVAGGEQNTASGYLSVASGGLGNDVSGQFSTIGGGIGNISRGERATVGGGSSNRGEGDYSVAAGGNRNWATGGYSSVGGGDNNIAGEAHSTVGGGYFNTAAGPYSTVPGGIANFALGESSHAAGQFAVAGHDGAFVWADASTVDRFSSTAENQYLIRATGGVGVGVADPQTALDVAGTIRSRAGGVQFPDGTIQATSAFNGWSFSNGVFQVSAAQPFVISLGDQPAFRLEPNSFAANFIAGSAENVINDGTAATISGGWRNTVNATAASIGGGQGNTAGALLSTVGGGGGNTAGGVRSTVAGGNANTASGSSAVVGGGDDNVASGPAAFIGGGSSHRVSGSFGAIVAGQSNQATNDFAFVGGGSRNIGGAPYAVVGGGRSNAAVTLYSVVGGGEGNVGSGGYSVVGGGQQNRAGGTDAVVGGGRENEAGGSAAVVGGGWGNEASGTYAAVPGGVNNTAGGYASFAGGQSAAAVHAGAFVWADSSGAAFGSTGDNQFLIRAAGGVGIGLDHPETALDVAGIIRSRTGGVQFPDGTTQLTAASLEGWGVANGVFQTTGDSPFAVQVGDHVGLRVEPGGIAPNFIAGSPENVVSNGLAAATIGGGWRNTVNGASGTVGGGQGNTAGGLASVVGGGAGNTASGARSGVGAGNQNTAAGALSTIAGGQLNSITSGGIAAFVGGGNRNSASAADAVIGGGALNVVAAIGGFIGGGTSNQVSAEYSVVAGGSLNSANVANAAVGGGSGNQAGGRNSTIGGGEENTTVGRQSTIGGGWRNATLGQYATVPGGLGNAAAGLASFAAGQSAKALHSGSFVWSDFSSADFTTTGDNQFLIRAVGGVGIGTASPQAALDVAGEVRSTVFTPTSDRHAKENFAPVDPQEVLAKVAALPISRWNFKTLPGADHFGPMAQDFHAAFGLNGGDDRHIATVDADGVALAAIQGLNQKLDQKSAEVETLKLQNAELLRRLDALEQRLR